MRNDPILRMVLCLLSYLLFFSVARSPAQEIVQKGPLIIHEDKHDISPVIREMPFLALQPRVQGMVLPHRGDGPSHIDNTPDSVLQSNPGLQVSTTSGQNFDGVSDRDALVPPDNECLRRLYPVVETVNISHSPRGEIV